MLREPKWNMPFFHNNYIILQASSGRGGWPMSVFLTPTLIPIAGGTYFPPQDKFQRPGFPTVLKNLSAQVISYFYACRLSVIMEAGP
jgi:uncharacterized protein YyaL (SSP411 family)